MFPIAVFAVGSGIQLPIFLSRRVLLFTSENPENLFVQMSELTTRRSRTSSLNRSMVYLVYTEVRGSEYRNYQILSQITLALVTIVAPLLAMICFVFVHPVPLGTFRSLQRFELFIETLQ